MAEAAKRLGVSPSLIYALVAARLLKHERIGLKRGVIRIAEEALDEYRRTREVGIAVASTNPDRSRVRLDHLDLP